MLARFEELTDDQWNLLVPSIPAPAHTGRPRADDRSAIDGILHVLMGGWM
jgi:transposase